jgi:hypothetical protein
MSREEEKRSENDYFGESRSMDGVGDKVGERGAGTGVDQLRNRGTFGHEKRSDEMSAHLR